MCFPPSLQPTQYIFYMPMARCRLFVLNVPLNTDKTKPSLWLSDYNWLVMTMMMLTDLRSDRRLPRHGAAVSAARHEDCPVVESEVERVARLRAESPRLAAQCTAVSLAVFHLEETETEGDL